MNKKRSIVAAITLFAMAIMLAAVSASAAEDPPQGECGTLATCGTWDVTLPSGAAAGTRSRNLRRRRHDRRERGSPRDASRRFARSVGADRAVSVLGHESLLQVQPAERCVSRHAEGERDGASRPGPQVVHRRLDLGTARPGRKPDRRWSAGALHKASGSRLSRSRISRHDRQRSVLALVLVALSLGAAHAPASRDVRAAPAPFEVVIDGFRSPATPVEKFFSGFGTRDPSAPPPRSAPRGTPWIFEWLGTSGWSTARGSSAQ